MSNQRFFNQSSAVSTYEYDHDDKRSQVGGSGHPHTDEAVMFSRHDVPQETWKKRHEKLKSSFSAWSSLWLLLICYSWCRDLQLLFRTIFPQGFQGKNLQTFVLLVLSEGFNAGHQDIVVAQKFIQQEPTEAVTKALILHRIWMHSDRDGVTAAQTRCYRDSRSSHLAWPPWRGCWASAGCSETNVGSHTPVNIPRCIPHEATLSTTDVISKGGSSSICCLTHWSSSVWQQRRCDTPLSITLIYCTLLCTLYSVSQTRGFFFANDGQIFIPNWLRLKNETSMTSRGQIKMAQPQLNYFNVFKLLLCNKYTAHSKWQTRVKKLYCPSHSDRAQKTTET